MDLPGLSCGHRPDSTSTPRACIQPFLLLFLLGLLSLAVGGCASAPRTAVQRPFDFNKDTFAYPNELLWEYGYDTNGHWTGHAPEKKKEHQYALHCFVVARSAAQFYKFARFEPELPATDEEAYRKLVKKVVGTYPSHSLPEEKKIVIPGYADLRSFSATHEELLKAECGSAMQSYFQRGHWRMILPFTHSQQEHSAERLVEALRQDGIAVVHLLTFPSLQINHAILLFGAATGDGKIRYDAYDPNDPSRPTVLTFDQRERHFVYPANKYFPGGPLKVYQVYHRWNY